MARKRVMDVGRVLDWTVGSVIGAAFLSACTAVWGALNGSIATVWSFAAAHPAESAMWTLLAFLIGGSVGMLASLMAHRGRLAAKDEEIAALQKPETERLGRIAKVKPSWDELSPGERREVIDVYLAGGTLAPTDDQRKHMDEWVAMRGLLEFDGRMLRIRDGVSDLIEGDARSSLNLIMARVDDLSGERDSLAEELASLRAEPNDEERLAILYGRIVPGFSRAKARAAMKAYRADGMAKLDASAASEVAGSIQAGQRVFVREALVMFGTAIPQEMYGITDEFRAWLSEPGNLSKLEGRCG